KAVSIGPQVFDPLLYPVQNRDHVVSTDQMLATVWNGRIVSDPPLTRHLNAVRHAIAPHGADQQLLRTVPRTRFRFIGDVTEARSPETSATKDPDPSSSLPGLPALHLPDKPSIAVLPFQNLSGDVEQVYFADGVVEDIITALSRVRW